MRIGLVTCCELPEPDVDQELMLSAFNAAGHETDMVPWDGPSSGAHDLLILRSCWNYHLSPEAFVMWLEETASSTLVLNPPDLVGWNLHKGYLLDLADRGIPIVPSRFVEVGESPVLTEEERGQKIVIKPAISAGSWKTQVFEPSDQAAEPFLAELTRTRDAMIQPYVSSVDGVGERSLIWINGEVTHIVRKTPRFEDQDESVSEALQATPEELAFAEQVMSGVSGALYARVDIMRGEDGEILLSELELIEPSLFFMQNPRALEQLVVSASRFWEDKIGVID